MYWKQIPMEPKPKPIETKTSPFVLPKSTTNSLQNVKIKQMKYKRNNTNLFLNIFMGLFIVAVTGLVVYVLISLSQLQKLSVNESIVNNINNTTVPVSNEDEVPDVPITPWERKDFKINNNTVWSLLVPGNFTETKSTQEGTITLTGFDNDQNYKVILNFPLFSNYPGGEPKNLKDWIQSELAFLNPEGSLEVSSESFTLDKNIEATLLININEVTADSGNARLFGNKKSLVLYIDKTKTRNYSKITVVPENEYSEETAKAFFSRIISSLEFN